MDSNLSKFISESRSQGLSDTEIKTQLMNAGWPEAAVNQAIGVGSPQIPTPQYHNSHSSSNFGMWVVFEYVLMFITLASSATGFAGILHRLMDDKIAPVTAVGTSLYGIASYYSDYLLPTYIASLIISFPIFAFLALRLRKKLISNPEIRKIKVRKVFIYIALTWTFLALLSRFIRTVYNFLSGEAAVANVFSHLIVTLLVSGAIFVYFAWEIKQDNKVE